MLLAMTPSARHQPSLRPPSVLTMLLKFSICMRRVYRFFHAGVPKGMLW